MNFNELPLVKEGESKIIRYMGNGLVAIKLKPTVYSYTYNRAAVIAGSDSIRYECCKILCKVLQDHIEHSYLDYQDGIIISKLIVEDFVPTDCDVRQLPKFCPIEVVVKDKHVGTPKHRYFGIEKYKTRGNTTISADVIYPNRVVRFDWRNPNIGPDGQRLCDEPMPEDMADFYINVVAARNTAKRAYLYLYKFLSDRGLELTDICFFIDRNGETIFSEITPDCMRVTLKGDSLDKDVWRAGGSSPLLMEKWTRFLEMIK